MNAAIAFDFAERPRPRQQIVADAADAAILIEVAVVVGGLLAVGELRILIGGAIDGAGRGQAQPVEILLEAERAAGGRIKRILAQAGLNVRAAGIVGADPQMQFGKDAGVAVDIEPGVDLDLRRQFTFFLASVMLDHGSDSALGRPRNSSPCYATQQSSRGDVLRRCRLSGLARYRGGEGRR